MFTLIHKHRVAMKEPRAFIALIGWAITCGHVMTLSRLRISGRARTSHSACLRAFAGNVPTAGAVAVDLKAGRSDNDRVFELDEPPAWMLERGFDRHYHPGFEWPVGIVGVVGYRTRIGEPRRLGADQSHGVRQEVGVVVQL